MSKEWNIDDYLGMFGDGISTDKHGTEEAAQAVCDGLMKEGMGGNLSTLPIRTWISKVKDDEPI